MSASPTEEASPIKGDKRVFTDKEEKVLKAAWSCLKAPPEIDIEKLKVAAEFNTTKTASNTWGVIKKKLAAMAPPAAAEGDDSTLTTPNTKSTSKKRGKKAAATDGDGVDENQDFETPTKKRGKKTAATEGEGEDQDFETPTKKRKTRKVVKAGGEGVTTTEIIKTEEAEEDAEN